MSISSAPLNITKGLKTLGEDILWYRERGANDGGIPRISRGMEGGGLYLLNLRLFENRLLKLRFPRTG